MRCEPEIGKAARGRYTRAMAVAAVLYIGVVALGVTVIDRFAPPAWLTIVLALLPLAPAMIAVRAYLDYFRALDEFQRRVQTEALVVTLAVVTLGAFSYGFLEEWAGFPHVPLFWVFPAVMLTWTVAQIALRARYK